MTVRASLGERLAPRPPPGHATIEFRRTGRRTAVATALATSPLRLLEPRNHGDAAWVFLASLGGGLVDGDCVEARIDAAENTTAFIGTQGSTKVYRSPRGCSQRLAVRVEGGAALAIVPDPVVCFAGARYAQKIDVALAPDASLLLFDGYTCGRSAMGERWAFSRFGSRTTIARRGAPLFADATLLDSARGSLSERMGRFDVVLSLVVFGPRFAAVRGAMLAMGAAALRADSAKDAVASASPLGSDGAILRVAAERFEIGSRLLRPSFAALATLLGDDPFARKW